MLRRRLLGLAMVALGATAVACGSDDAGGQTPKDGGKVELVFSVSKNARQSSNLVVPLMGTVYGSIFLTEDVGLTGPRDGAESFGDVEVSGVDLRSSDTSAQSWVSGALDEGNYTFLGFYDVDGNGAATKEPKSGDPVTLPVINKFSIETGRTVKVTASFDMVL